MHYTSIENIHKVIDPLFLDALRAELDTALEIAVPRQRDAALLAFQQKLASPTFLDPACGSGNFLTETFLSLRRLENQAIAARYKGQGVLGLVENPIRVSIHQFHGIEINDFAVSVAKTALWIADSQMLAETAQIVRLPLHFLPLESYDGIVEGNALLLDWGKLNSRGGAETRRNFDYIMGNPPFVGHQYRSAAQTADMDAVFADFKTHGKLDFVTSWFKKAFDLQQKSPSTRTAFVATNSICQGESVATLWKPLLDRGLHIDFAHRTFRWDSESSEKAHVHCVIIGFSSRPPTIPSISSIPPIPSLPLYDGDRFSLVPHINAYLLPAPDVFIQNRTAPRTPGFPKMSKGSQPTDGGNLILSPAERDSLLAETPALEPFVRPYISSDDVINGKTRYCLWLKDASPHLYRSSSELMRRLAAVAEMRSKSPTASVRRDAETPMLFTQIRQPETDYLAIPEVSSECRRYIPIAYCSCNIIASNKLYIIPNASLWLFGILISNVHMAWMRVVCGRLKSDYSYSPAVYNNFPWPDLRASASPREKIETTARAILDARAAHPDATLADLYDPLTMPPDLLAAHRVNDRAVMSAYGFPLNMPESACVAELFKLYQTLASAQ